MNYPDQLQIRDVVTRLLSEDKKYSMKDRRSIARRPFFRPITLYLGREQGDPQSGFARDLNESGIGLVHDFAIEPGKIANIAVHRLWDAPAVIRANLPLVRKLGKRMVHQWLEHLLDRSRLILRENWAGANAFAGEHSHHELIGVNSIQHRLFHGQSIAAKKVSLHLVPRLANSMASSSAT